MLDMEGPRRAAISRAIGKGLVICLIAALGGLAAAVLLAHTDWGRDHVRALVVDQANRRLTATLEIGRLDGSLFEEIRLSDVRLSRDGQTVFSAEEVAVRYTLRELLRSDLLVREVRLVRPRVAAAKDQQGRWNLASLVRQREATSPTPGPVHPVRIDAIQVIDASIAIESPLVFGAAHVPTRFTAVDGRLAFARTGAGWHLTFFDLSFDGREPDLTMDRFSGTISKDTSGWSLDTLDIRTPRSVIAVTGRIERTQPHTTLDLRARTAPFAFQEWAQVVPGLSRIGVEARFDLRLQGPTDRLAADVDLQSDGGDINAALVLNGIIPGWHATGSATLSYLDLARWLDDPGHASSITGDVNVDLDLHLGRGVPEGTYAFEGSHARYRGYEGTDVRARGTLTAREVVIDSADAAVYGAAVRLSAGAIGYDDPQPFRFRGRASRLDLRRLPRNIPVPHVESTLAFDFDVNGRFESPTISGGATFGPSVFLGAAIGAGATGTIDTTASPITYGGEGEITGLPIERLASDLEIAWLDDPRYRGTVSGRFHAQGQGTDAATMTLSGGGRLTEGVLPGGTFSDADVTLSIEGGSLATTYAGAFTNVDPALLIGDGRFAATLTGSGQVDLHLPRFLVRSPALTDIDLEAGIRLSGGAVRGVHLDAATLRGSLAAGILQVDEAVVSGPAFLAQATGTVAFADDGDGTLTYRVGRADLDVLSTLVDADLDGDASADGQVTGSWSNLRVTGNALVGELAAAGLRALAVDAKYDASFRPGRARDATASLDGSASFVEVSGQTFDEIAGTVTYDAGLVRADLALERPGLAGRVAGEARLPGGGQVDVVDLRIDLQEAGWQLTRSERPSTITWDRSGLTVTPVEFTNVTDRAQRIGLSGTWRHDGTGALHVTTSAVAIEALPGLAGGSSPYAGLLTLHATITGTREQPIVTGNVSIVNGRVRQLAYEEFYGRIEYVGGMFEVGVRLDQSPGAWLTASGAVPLGLIDRMQPERPMYLAIASTPINLGLIEGLTGIVHEVSGQAQLNVSVVGTSHEPRFTGGVTLSDAGFVVTSTGARYGRGRGVIDFTQERITVRDFRIEDGASRAVEVTGSVGASELRFQDLAIQIAARDFELLRNEYGTISADARLTLSGRIEAPQIDGTLAITSGLVRADRILDRVLFQPYALEDAGGASRPIDAIAALNPWDRLSMDVSVDVPGTLRLTGDNVQVAPGTPIGLGNIDLRMAGKLRLRKGPAEALAVTGALDQITGRYAFQGRRFDLDPASSITFRGDLDPDLQVTVHRVISGVDVRVAIAGPLSDPALQLTSAPPLDSSDILALIVFNTTANQLSLAQQEQLAVRAGTLAAGFLAAPLVTALERSLGIDLLEIEAPDTGGARVTIGDEIAPGLVARFSRQFGSDEYDEATLEYNLSRLFRIRATFSDAGSTIRSPFRRVERAGIDLLLFFSF